LKIYKAKSHTQKQKNGIDKSYSIGMYV